MSLCQWQSFHSGTKVKKKQKRTTVKKKKKEITTADKKKTASYTKGDYTLLLSYW